MYANGDDTTVIQEILLVLDSGNNSIQFTGLDTANNRYQIMIQADADLNEGAGEELLFVVDEVTFVEAN